MSNESQLKNYFLEKILPGLVGPATIIIGLLVVTYFGYLSLNTRVSALENDSVRKDVLIETLEPMKADIKEMKSDIKTLIKETK